jgi:protein HIRA/HIR1
MSSLDSIKIIRPDIVSHCDPGKKSRLAIYSIDFQYGGWRVATGGGDTTVKVWDAYSMVSSTDASDEFLLATLSNHSKSVNVVRWSRDGQFLASGSDDCYVLIYERSFDSSTSSQPFGSSAQKNRV